MAPSCSGVMEMPSPNEHILPTPPSFSGITSSGYVPSLLARNVIAGQFAQAVFVGVVSNLFESQLAPQRLEIGVIGVRQSFCEIHPAAAPERNLSFFRDQVLRSAPPAPRKV